MKIFTDYHIVEPNAAIDITHTRYLGKYIIHITFSDGTQKSVDFKPFLIKSIHPSITKYLDKTLFQQFSITNGNINWNNYELIFPLHDLYEGNIS